MKGIVFTEFLDMVEAEFGEDVLENVLDGAMLSHAGGYTAVGWYPHHELVSLVRSLAQESKLPIDALYRTYGKYFFGVLARQYGYMISELPDAFTLLEKLDTYIHKEVQKLYPDAELPHFEAERVGDTLLLFYYSNRKMVDFAEGLMEGCLAHFGDEATIEREPMDEDGRRYKFVLVKK